MKLLDLLLCTIIRLLISLRYRVEIRGVDAIARRGRRGIVFLPNHPALMDPVILVASLFQPFAPTVLGDKNQVDRFFIRWLAKRVGVRTIPDVRDYGISAVPQVEAVIRETIQAVNTGANLLFYPSGHSYRSRYESLRGNSAVEEVMRLAPNARVVLVRTRGLWGSSFSYAGGSVPSVGRALKSGLLAMARSYLLFMPRRRVTIELVEPKDFPRIVDRHVLNAYLERFYNQDPPPNTYVPYTPWETPGPQARPEPLPPRITGDLGSVSLETRRIVTEYLRQITGSPELRDADRLAYDLGMDSLARAELLVWLCSEFGFPESDVDSLQTVGDVLLAARGQLLAAKPLDLAPIPAAWFRARGHARVERIDGDTVAHAFLAAATAAPDRAMLADQRSGAKTRRDIITGIFALRHAFEQMPGERIGIMLPASVAANISYLTALFAGKTPVLVNWTTGARNIKHSLDSLGVQRVITAGPLVQRIESQGTDLSAISGRLIMLEDLARGITRTDKLKAFIKARLPWTSLRHARISPTAAILLTSGSEAAPKAVPLTHVNLLTNLRDVLKMIRLYEDDCLLGFLPPFHSFGLTVTMLLPMLCGLRVAYHANPTEGWLLARLIQAYHANILIGTPTFLNGILRAAGDSQLHSLRLAVTGAEKCPQRTYDTLAHICPRATIVEGYGITECSPIVSGNDELNPRIGTIGKPLPSVEYAIVDVDDPQRRVAIGEHGMLLVRGPSIFGGYLNPDAPSPFVEFEGRQWYRTGDLVSEDAEGALTFRGRLKRFVKIAGEMISLPAIEAALEPHFAGETDEGPVIAVEATAHESHPELVLFTTRPTDRSQVNALLRDAGFSPIHNMTRVIEVEQLPVLGTGKTDYRSLRAML